MTETLVQKNIFAAPVETVFAAIADSEQHAAVTGAPADLGSEPGSAFTTHGGAIEGWLLAIAPNEYIVQAWRPADWAAGIYSVVRYDFAASGDATELTLMHSSVPEGAGVHLEDGWNERYWGPLADYLA
jgi:activator of HSP90 ATPase